MKRAEIEAIACGLRGTVKSRIEAAPIPSVLFGLLTGLVIGLFPRLIFLVILIAAIVAVVLWLFAETDTLAGDAAAANEEKDVTSRSNDDKPQF